MDNSPENPGDAQDTATSAHTEDRVITRWSETAESTRSVTEYAKVGTRPEIAPGGTLDQAAESEPHTPIMENTPRSQEKLLVVGIGSSAGGLEALERFFHNLPGNTGMTFILVPHLDPTHPSHLTDLIQKITSMPVYQVRNRMKIRPNTVYIIPPDWIMGIMHGVLRLVRRYEGDGVSTINYFMRTLAEDQGHRSACVILSGMGSDGAEAVALMRQEFGIVLVQDPQTAKYDSMPKAAIETGLVDHVLPPDQMPAKLLEWSVSEVQSHRPVQEEVVVSADQTMDEVFRVLRAGSGHDFSSYKRSTMLRRIQRRMAARKLRSIEDYIKLLNSAPDEANQLLQDLLIGVTRFFRDPEAFESLKQNGLLPLLQGADPHRTLRIWIPGCSGGEEPYSIAILLQECFEDLGRDFPTQIFATDIDAFSIERARIGLYPKEVTRDIGKRRLEKYFTLEDNAYRIKSSLRQMLVFAPQNVIMDPPFTRLDLLCCRNLLIYFDGALQKRLFPLFHYSLRPEGLLFLGTAESVGNFDQLFSTVDKKWKIFKRIEGQEPPLPSISFRTGFASSSVGRAQPTAPTHVDPPFVLRTVERGLLQRYVPPCAVVDGQGHILYVHGRTGLFLEPASGPANWNILQMAREEFKLPLTNALRKANASKREIKLEPITTSSSDGNIAVAITVQPIEGGKKEKIMLVSFEVSEPILGVDTAAQSSISPSSEHIRELQQELSRTRERLQTSIEEMETSNEELRSVNEEYQSTNEELQSSNEELNTSREELQSLNEELETVNAESESRLQILHMDYQDLRSLIENLQIPVMVVDTHVRIKSFTASITEFISLIKADIGRPLSDFSQRLGYPDLVQDIEASLTSLSTKTVTTQINGKTWNVAIRPLRGLGDSIAGVMVAFLDITHQKATEKRAVELTAKLRREVLRIEAILNTVRVGLVVLDPGFRIESANRTFYNLFKTDPDVTLGRNLFELGAGQWDIPELRQLLKEILPQQKVMFNYRISQKFPEIGVRTMVLNARTLEQDDGAPMGVLLVIEDESPGTETGDGSSKGVAS